MANLLQWKEGEGYDIHVLRGGTALASKALDQSLELDTSSTALPPRFTAHFKGAPSNLGVDVNPATGQVTAAVQPSVPPKFPNFNFLMTATQVVGGVSTSETQIRIHIHDSIKKIWLTPSSLTIHEQANECRFTVLALFDDGTVGDITEWAQLTYTKGNHFTVDVRNVGDTFNGEPEIIGGRLIALRADFPDEPEITVNLKLKSPPTDLTFTARVFPQPSWEDVAKDQKTKVKWVAGPQVPNENDLASSKADSIKSVVESRANILFISEGFTSNQEQDFRKKVVELTVNELRTQVEPFKLLSGSINYWSVFVPSREEGIGILGDHQISGTSPNQVALEVPLPDPPVQPQWALQNMIHEAGLPLPSDAPVANPAAWLSSRALLYALPAASVDAASLSNWNDLRHRTLLNERNTAFGIAHYDRPRASGQGLMSEEHLMHDPRRISEKSIKEFVENLVYPLNGLPIGSRWQDNSAPDFRRVCFVCQSSKTGGTATNFYFAVGTALAFDVGVEAAVNGTNVKPRRIDKNFSVDVYASVVAHECGHALGLGDEYGGNDTFNTNVHPIPFDPNLQPDTLLAPIDPSTGLRVFDPSKIKWLWPRVSKAGFLDGPPDFQGAPDPIQFVVRLRKGDGKPFAKDDLVRIRESPVHRASNPFGILLIVDFAGADAVTVSYKNPGGPHVHLSLFNSPNKYVLVCTSINPGIESTLVAPRILGHIGTSNGPLNAVSPGAACVVGGSNSKPNITPVNLPTLSKRPPIKADIIGLYEGGGYHDCGVFRPAGRCRMRGGIDATIPFCHVCRYIIVDTIDPTKHGELDKLYTTVYPA